MMTYFQVKAERAFLATTFMMVWGTLIAAQGIVLLIYPFYRTVNHCYGHPPVSPPAESQ